MENKVDCQVVKVSKIKGVGTMRDNKNGAPTRRQPLKINAVKTTS